MSGRGEHEVNDRSTSLKTKITQTLRSSDSSGRHEPDQATAVRKDANPNASTAAENEPSASSLKTAKPTITLPSVRSVIANVDDDISCRICLRNDPREREKGRLIRPCNCCGTFSFVHERCLSHWLEITNNQHCDVCSFRFITQRSPMTFLDYLYSEQEEFGDVYLMLFALAFSLYVLSIGFSVSLIGMMGDWGTTGRVLFTFSLIFSSILIPLTVLIVRRQVLNFLTWRRTHFHVLVFENPQPALKTCSAGKENRNPTMSIMKEAKKQI